jgi:hypothetical protein
MPGEMCAVPLQAVASYQPVKTPITRACGRIVQSS